MLLICRICLFLTMVKIINHILVNITDQLLENDENAVEENEITIFDNERYSGNQISLIGYNSNSGKRITLIENELFFRIIQFLICLLIKIITIKINKN